LQFLFRDYCCSAFLVEFWYFSRIVVPPKSAMKIPIANETINAKQPRRATLDFPRPFLHSVIY